MNLNRFTDALWNLDTYWIFYDFDTVRHDDEWVDTVTDSGTVTNGDARAGICTLTPSDGSVVDNDEAYVASAKELFKFAASAPIYGKARLAFTEVSSPDVNIVFGFQNAVGADSLVDDGGGAKVSGSTLAIGKVDGETEWRVWSACNGTSTTTLSNLTATAGSTTFHELEIICGDWDGTRMQVSFKVDGEYLKDVNNIVISHSVLIANATEMQLFAGIKLGANTNNDTVLLDYLYGSQRR